MSTNVAESSVTIDGVVAVVDSGLVRVARHAPWSGLPLTGIEKTSKASATQRAGRAGRTRPGRALRLYTKADFDARPDHDMPEILRVDLAQTFLELRATGARDIAWLDPPKADAVMAAEALLTRLDAIDAKGDITDIGRRMLGFPLHPRQARLLVEADRRGVGEEGCVLAAVVGERDLRTAAKTSFGGGGGRARTTSRPSGAISSRFSICFMKRRARASRRTRSARWGSMSPPPTRRDARSSSSRARSCASAGRLPRTRRRRSTTRSCSSSVLAGFPDRVARRRKPGTRDLALAQGGTAELAETSAVRDAPWMVAVDAELVRGRTVVRTASEIEPDWLIDLFADRIREVADLASTKRRASSPADRRCPTKPSRSQRARAST